MSPDFHTYLQSLQSEGGTIPAIMDERTLLEVLSHHFHQEFTDIDALRSSGIHSVFLYEIPEGKKQFDINTVRLCIQDIALKPYSGKHIMVLRDFDTAGVATQNAALKLIEDCPDYSALILVVSSPKAILPTILSRAIVLFREPPITTLDAETEAKLEGWMRGEWMEWITHLYHREYSKSESILILTKVFPTLSGSDQSRCQWYIEWLATTHEKPRSILDAFFLSFPIFPKK